jgi:hypothetical protein
MNFETSYKILAIFYRRHMLVFRAQVRLEAGESSIGIEIDIEIDSIQFCAPVRLDTDTDTDFDFDFKQLGLCA